MDQATLVDLDVQAGRFLLDGLEQANLEISVALSMLSSDHDELRFVVASPYFDQIGRPKGYERIAAVLIQHHSYFRPPILILPMKDSFIRELRRRYAKANDVIGTRLGSQTIANRFVYDAYLYRIK